MSTERWERTKQILEDALKLPPGQRAAFVASACDDDEELRTEVESLISSHEAAGSQFLALNADEILGASAIDQARPFGAGQVVGQYRLIRELGQGGMGVVYTAEDLKLGRRVAIKFLPSELAHDPSTYPRFEREARAASALDHRNICSIHQLGEYEGQPFIVMQLLEGQTLREWIAQRTNVSDLERQDQLLGLAIQIADGMDAAHQKGIIHRDIKPANIFVTNKGEAKILDFGVAKFLESADAELGAASTATEGTRERNPNLTRTGLSFGTPWYLSPEQARGEKLDPRTDLFSFGLVLYEMVTGQRAFGTTAASASEVRDAVLNSAVTPLRELCPEISPQLEEIIRKALEKDRNRRFQSASEMRAALERVKLERSSAAPKSHRLQWLALTAVVAVLIGSAFLWVGYRRRASVNTRNSTSTPGITVRPSVAVLGFKNLAGVSDLDWLSAALGEMLTTELAAGEQLHTISEEDVASAKQQLLLAHLDAYSTDGLERIRTLLGTQVVVAGSYMVVRGKLQDTIRLDIRLQNMGSGGIPAVFSETGTRDDLLEVVARAGERLREALGIPRISPTEQLSVQSSLPSGPEAARLYAEGLEKLRASDNVNAHDLLQRAVDADPSNALAHSALAASWSSLGYEAKAATEAKRALELSTNLSREEKLLVEARYRETSHDWDKAIAVYQSLWSLFPDNVEYGLRLAQDQTSVRKAKDALATLESLRARPVADKNDPRIDLAEGWAQMTVSDLPAALGAAQSAGQKAKAQGRSLILARAREIEGITLDRKGDSTQALVALEEARSIYDKASDKSGIAHVCNDTAIVYWRQGNLAKAIELYEQARTAFEAIGSIAGVATAYEDEAIVLYDQGKLPDAKASYEKALEGHRKVEDILGTAQTLNSLANVLADEGKQSEAEKMYEKSLALSRQTNSQIDVATALTNLGLLFADRGKLSVARQHLEEALAIKRQIGHRSSIAQTISCLGDVLLSQGDIEAARKTHQEALALRIELGQKSTAAEDRLALAAMSLEEGNLDEASVSADSAVNEFHSDGRADREAAGHAVLAQIFLARNNALAAQKEMESALRLSPNHDNTIANMELAITGDRVKAVLGGAQAATKDLEAIRRKAASAGLLGVALEARLASGEIALKFLHAPSGRSALIAVQKDAAATGFGLIAHKAASAIKSKS